MTLQQRRFLRDSLIVSALGAGSAILIAQAAGFHGAPAAAAATKNVHTSAADVTAGAKVYQQNCAACHGNKAQGMGNVPALTAGNPVQSASDGSIFWFITKGDINNGMPAWAQLPAAQRWQVVSYVKSLGGGAAAAETHATGSVQNVKVEKPSGIISKSPAPPAPFTDYRYEVPGKYRKITVADLPAPHPSESATNGPRVVARPQGAWPKVPAGFKVETFLEGLDSPRRMINATNGDVIFTETTATGNVKIIHGVKGGKPGQVTTFATGLNTPFGLLLYPANNPQYLYVGDQDALMRFPYHLGDSVASGPGVKLAALKPGGGHRTRDIQITPDGKRLLVSVGSEENIGDGEIEDFRANILSFNLDGTDQQIYAAGIRNCVGTAMNPVTHELWCSVNERDGIGNNLVPDYVTSVKPGGFYGWPWYYIGNHRDERIANKHPELASKVIVPDVLIQPHSASLGMMFYDGSSFPAQYKGDIFASEHGSWNRAPRAGYELIRIPMDHATGKPKTGGYEDFMTGFVVDDDDVWGRPVAPLTLPDGSILVSDDGGNLIWRITYTGK